MGGSTKIFLCTHVRLAMLLPMKRISSSRSYTSPSFSHIDFFSDCLHFCHSPNSSKLPFVNAPSIGQHGLTFGTAMPLFTPMDFMQLWYIWCFIALYFWMPRHITFSICFSLLWSYVFHPLSSSAYFHIFFLLSFTDGLHIYLIYPQTHM
jgi:hypothetical protein